MSKWFVKMSPMARQEYLRQHPKSRLKGKGGLKAKTQATKTLTRLKRQPVTVRDEDDEGLF